MTKKLAILLGAGLDGCGGVTLAQEIERAFGDKVDIFYYAKKSFTSESVQEERKNKTWISVLSFKEAYKELKHYKMVWVITSPFSRNKKDYDLYLKMLSKLNNKKILFILARNRTMFSDGWASTEVFNKVDMVISILGEDNRYFKSMQELSDTPVYSLDINFFDMDNPEFKALNRKFKDKGDKISFIGRYANFKGFGYYVNAFVNKELPAGYLYTAEGGWFKTSGSTFSSTIGILSIICEKGKVKEKILKPGLKLYNNYEEYNNILDKEALHLFPSYSRPEMLERISKAKYLIIPYRFKKNYNSDSFRQNLEYVVQESIAIGTPVIMPNNFGEEFNINGIPLIEQDCGLIFFDSFLDIELAIVNYNKNYDKNVESMQRFFRENYNNKIRWKNFKKYLK